MILSPVLLVFILVLLIIYLIKFSKERPPNFPPGPPKLPILGSYWFMLVKNYKHVHLVLEEIANKYKTKLLGLHFGPHPVVVSFGYEYTKELLSRDEFTGRLDNIITRSRGGGELLGIFFADGQFWKNQRRFSLRYMRDFGFGRRAQSMEDWMVDEVKYLIDVLSNDPRPGDEDMCRKKGEVLVPDIFYGVFVNAVFHVLSSTRYDYHKLRDIGRGVLRFQRSTDGFGTAILIHPWLRHIAPNLSGYNDAILGHKVMLDFCKEVVKEHKQTFSDDYHRDFIDVFISEQQKLDRAGLDYGFTDKQLTMVVTDYVFASANAPSHQLSFYFALMCNHPEIQEKIQKEIDTVVGRSRLPNLDDRRDMPFTVASIRECIRIIPLVPIGIARRAVEDTTLGGYFIPKDTIMLGSIYSASYDKTVWEEPEKFLPERWLDKDGQLLKKDYTIGFGAGKRLCAGETFGRQNMFLVVAGLLQNFTFESTSGKPIPLDNDHLLPGQTVSIENGWIRAISR